MSSEAERDRWHEIVHAGLDLFAISGFHGTSVRQIARAVGLNEATLYHYFPSKDAILTAVFDQVLLERRALSGSYQAGPEAPLAEVLTQMGQLFLRHAMTPLEIKLMRLMMSEGPRLSEEGRQAFEQMNRASMQPAIDQLQRLTELGQVRRADPELVVMSFFAPLFLWKMCHAMGEHQSDLANAERLLQHQVDLLCRALQPAE